MIYEDDQLCVVDKPAGIATHSADKNLYWGWFDYVRWKNPDDPALSLLHRLDKDTSGVLIFGKTEQANRDLARQWEKGEVEKLYLFATRNRPSSTSWQINRKIQNLEAVTKFRSLGRKGKFFWIEAIPLSGRTHQIRVHAAASKIPIVGDIEYGDPHDPWPLLLHAKELGLTLPVSGRKMRFQAPIPAHFNADLPQEAWWERASILRGLVEESSDALRWIHGAADGFAHQAVERYGDVWVLYQYGEVEDPWLEKKLGRENCILKKYLGQGRVESLGGSKEPKSVCEQDLKFEIRFDEATTTGLFLDQRENRLWLRRLLPKAPEGAVLNCFAHTCSFSVVAARCGRATVNVDLSAKYLEWGKGNFALNHIDPEINHRWLKGDSGEWLKRLKKRDEKFAVIILDPPSFSRGKAGDFRVERDLGPLVRQAASLLVVGGSLLISTNFQKWTPPIFLSKVLKEFHGRKITATQIPLPPDFPHKAGEKLWMKSVWITT